MKEADSLIKRAMKYLKSARLLLDTLADLTAAINKELAANPLRTIFNHCKQVIHLATGLIVGYPPCPNITYFSSFIKTRYGLEVVYGTHPIPEKYLKIHNQLETWKDPEWQKIIEPTLVNEKTRLSYD